ncbi:MAG: hypothetical protein KDC85_06690 [Saprospiraceae bacterium]|nr:hypothetical protein [Saprospiraceae bacterium]MCB9324836.1 hypothetical protein [Lewinellaceae bacterium]
MNNYEKIYQDLLKQYTVEEIAESMMIPANLTEDEQKEANEALKAFRFKVLSERTEEQRIYSDLLRFRYQLENYLQNETFDPEKSFGKQVEEYARILKRTKKKLSEDLDIHYTRLSRIINDREEPNIELTYRLEKHSGMLIPALTWWKLITKKQEYLIKQDNEVRKEEASKVKDAMKFRA